MPYKLRDFGTAAVLALTLVALSAPLAQAQQGMLTSDGPVTLTGTPTEDQDGRAVLTATQTGEASANSLTAFGGTTQCPNAIYTGHEAAVTPHEGIADGATSITITPHYGKCTTFGAPSTIDMNGCDFQLDLEATNGTDKYAAKSTITCPTEKHITITVFSMAKFHNEGKPFCHITITESAGGYAGISATDTTNGEVDFSGTITGISADKTSPTGNILCPTESTSVASLTQDLSAEGKDEAGETVLIGLRHLAEVGELYSESTEASNALTAFEGISKCPEAIYTGHRAGVTPHEPVPSGSTSITVTPHFGTCEVSGLPVTIDMNGCDFLLDLESTGGVDAYEVHTTIVCSGGNHIQWTAFSSETHSVESRFCTLTFTEKEGGYGGLQATDLTNGEVEVSGALEGITAHRSGGGILCPKATTETGILDLSILVEGHSKAGADTSISLSEKQPPNGVFTSTGPVTLDGTTTGTANANSLTAFGGELQCPNVLYTGHELNSFSKGIPSGSSSATITPHYKTCTGFGAPATVDMNGCDYVFELKEAVVGGTDEYKVTAKVEGCAAGKNPVMTIFGSAAKHTSNEPFCEVEFTPETDPKKQNLVLRDTTNGFLDLTGTVEELAVHKRSPTGSILCPTETTTTAILHLDLTISGTNAVGAATTVSLSGK
jgi:hypothetical protein